MSAPRTKIFVGHLPDGCRNEDLQSLFENYGTVKECDVINKYGFVHMSTPEEAEAAIRALNNYNFMGSSLSVEPSKSRLHPEPGAPGRAKGGMPPSNFRRGGGSGGGFQRNGFGPSNSPNPNGYRASPFNSPSFPTPANDTFFGDRPFGYNNRDRIRPYPPSPTSTYDVHMPSLPSPREEFARRPIAAAPGLRDAYARPITSVTSRTDLYDRRPMTSTSDFMFSQKSSVPMTTSTPSQNRPYWCDDTPSNTFFPHLLN